MKNANIFVSLGNSQADLQAGQADTFQAQHIVGIAVAAILVEILIPYPILLYLFLKRTKWIIDRLWFSIPDKKKILEED